MLISLDFDDVLYDLHSLNEKYMQQTYYSQFKKETIKSHTELYEKFPSIKQELWNNHTEYCRGKLLPGALEFYQELVNTFGENNIQIVTNSLPDVIVAKTQMIRNFGINCLVIHEKDKYKHTAGTILIDDYYLNIQEHINYTDGYGILANINRLAHVEADRSNISHIFIEENIRCKYLESYNVILSEVKRYFNSESYKVAAINKRPDSTYEIICVKKQSHKMTLIISSTRPNIEIGSEYHLDSLLSVIGLGSIISLSNHHIKNILTDNILGFAVTYDAYTFPKFVENYFQHESSLKGNAHTLENIILKANQAGIYCSASELKCYDVAFNRNLNEQNQFIYMDLNEKYITELYKLETGYIGIKDGRFVAAYIVNRNYAFDFDTEIYSIKLGKIKSKSVHELSKMQRAHNIIVDINSSISAGEEIKKSYIINLIDSLNHEYIIDSFEKDETLRNAQNAQAADGNVESNTDCENAQVKFDSTSDADPDKKIVCTIEHNFLIDPSQKDKIFNALGEISSQLNNIPVPPGGVDISLKFDGKFSKSLKIADKMYNLTKAEDIYKSSASVLDKFKDDFVDQEINTQGMDYQENEKYGYYYHPADRSRIDELMKYSAFQSRFFNAEFADRFHQNLTNLAKIFQVDREDSKLYYIQGFKK